MVSGLVTILAFHMIDITNYANFVIRHVGVPRSVLSDVNKEAGTKVGPDQLGPPVGVGSTGIVSNHEKTKLNEILKLLPI